MTESEQKWIEVEAAVSAPVAVAQLVQSQNTEPYAIRVMDRELYWLDMCLAPRANNARLCYRDHWGSSRYERIGNTFLLPPGEDVLLRSDGGVRQRSIFCCIAPESLRGWLERDFHWRGRRLEASLDIAAPRVKALLVRLVEEIQQPGFAAELMVELLTGQLSIELGRYFLQCDDNAPRNELAPWRLRLIDERLCDGSGAPTLAELAALCNLSVRQLTRGFRASRGCSIGDYVASRRIELAKQMLASEQPVKSVAYALGFSSPSGFCAAFRRATGMSPGEFRAALQPRH